MGAVLVSYNLGERHAFSRDMMTPTTQMVVGPDGIAQAVSGAGRAGRFRTALAAQPYGWSPYSGDDSGCGRALRLQRISAAGAVSAGAARNT